MKLSYGSPRNLPWWLALCMSDAEIKEYNDKFIVEVDTMDKTGGYCVKCGTVWAAPGRCKCKMFAMLGSGENDRAKGIKEMTPRETSLKDKPSDEWGPTAKAIWNAAIEAAVKQCDEMGEEERISYNLRTLKK